MIKKGLVCAIVVLFIGMSIVPLAGSISMENRFTAETQPWKYGSEDDNDAEAPITTLLWPPDTAVIMGYLTDEFTNEPVENARVRLIWKNEYINSTFTDESGFFYMNTPAGFIHLWPTKLGYKDDWWVKIGFIEDNETIWKNLSIIPFPPFNSTICGYVTDGMTNEPIEDVHCTYYWTYYGDMIYWGAGTDKVRRLINIFVSVGKGNGLLFFRLTLNRLFDLEIELRHVEGFLKDSKSAFLDRPYAFFNGVQL